MSETVQLEKAFHSVDETKRIVPPVPPMELISQILVILASVVGGTAILPKIIDGFIKNKAYSIGISLILSIVIILPNLISLLKKGK